MIRKKRIGKGISKILSGLLVFGMVAGLVPAVPGGTVHAKAADVSEPGVAVYATKKQLMTAFTPDADGNAANVGKLLFGKNASGDAQDWYILGKDKGVQGDNTVIFAASPMEENVLFNDIGDKTYVEDYGTYTDDNPTEVNANHYGASNLRAVLQRMAGDTNYFSDIEQTLMQATTVITKDVKIKKDYTTTDKLYAPAGDYGAVILKVASDNSMLLQRSAYWSKEEFWLRSPNYHDGYTTSNDAYYTSLTKQNVQNIRVNFKNYSVRPAANLDLSNVLFASAVSVKSGKIEEALTLRLDG